MSHFEPEVVFGSWVEVTGPSGTEWIEADLVGQVEEYPRPSQTESAEGSQQDRLAIPIPEQLQPYCESTTAYEIKLVEGWGARLTAPGYLDCTAWTVFKTEAEAREYLEEEQADEGRSAYPGAG